MCTPAPTLWHHVDSEAWRKPSSFALRGTGQRPTSSLLFDLFGFSAPKKTCDLRSCKCASGQDNDNIASCCSDDPLANTCVMLSSLFFYELPLNKATQPLSLSPQTPTHKLWMLDAFPKNSSLKLARNQQAG